MFNVVVCKKYQLYDSRKSVQKCRQLQIKNTRPKKKIKENPHTKENSIRKYGLKLFIQERPKKTKTDKKNTIAPIYANLTQV